MSSRLEDMAGSADSLLVERSRAGDTAAFGELYGRHYHRLLRFVRVRVREPELAEDMVQETFARAFAGVDRLRKPDRFYPWLTVIARNAIVRHRRRDARVCRITDADARGASDSPDTDLLRRIDQEDVQRAMARLRPRHRQVLELRERDELTYEEIAERMGIAVTAVTPLLFRARQALRREYFALLDREGRLLGLVPAALAGWRRLRMRASQYAAWLPDANALCASATCIAVGVGSLLLPSGAAELSPRAETVATPRHQQETQTPASSVVQSADIRQSVVPSRRPAPSEAGPAPTKVVPGVAEAGINNTRGTQWTRERAREMPIYYEVGPAGFAADPEQFRHDMESTLAGNPEWMEGS